MLHALSPVKKTTPCRLFRWTLGGRGSAEPIRTSTTTLAKNGEPTPGATGRHVRAGRGDVVIRAGARGARAHRFSPHRRTAELRALAAVVHDDSNERNGNGKDRHERQRLP